MTASGARFSPPISNPHEYEALSYTWGTLAKDFPIIVVSEDLAMQSAILATPHLYEALVRLRRPSETRILWIDQLCINQDDDAERSQQVQLMEKIYSNAKCTLVWLGEDDGKSEAIDRLAQELAGMPNNSIVDDFELVKKRINEGTSISQTLTNLLNRRWFSRAWVYQEATVSKHVKVMCGDIQLSLETLLRLVCAVYTIENEQGGYARSLALQSIGFDSLYLIQHGKGGCGDPECPRKEVKDDNFLGLLMQALQQFEATDPHDLIYAFLAFKGNTVIIPNYRLPVSTVWRDTARSIIQSSGCLDIFAAVGGGERQELPSWVPSWSQCYPYARPITAPDFKTNFCASKMPHVEPEGKDADSDVNVLHVKGKVIGTIKWISPFKFDHHYHRDGPEGTKTALNFGEQKVQLERFLKFVDQSQPQIHTLLESLDRVLMRTLLADGAFGSKQPLPDPIDDIIRVCHDEQRIQALKDRHRATRSDAEQRDVEILDRLRDHGLIAQQKCLFLSDSFEPGLAPAAAQPGDLICILRGSKVPCVLRKATDAAQDRYHVVSQCYLDGWMYHERRPPRAKEWSEEVAEEFALA
jgi:Heterokaryon incompatibility protein (HET)